MTEHIYELSGRSLCLGQIDAKRLPKFMQGQPLRQTRKLASVRHHASQRLGGKWFATAGYQHGFAAPVGCAEDLDLGKHRRYRHEKPLAAGPALVLCLDDVEAAELTFFAIEHDPASLRNGSLARERRSAQMVRTARRRARLQLAFVL